MAHRRFYFGMFALAFSAYSAMVYTATPNLEPQRPLTESAAHGQRLYQEYNCVACHVSLTELAAPMANQFPEDLPATGWQARHPRTWAIALSALAVLGAAAAALVGSSAARLDPAWNREGPTRVPRAATQAAGAMPLDV